RRARRRRRAFRDRRRRRRHPADSRLRHRRRCAGEGDSQPPPRIGRRVNALFLTHRLPYAPNRGDRIRAYYLLREMSQFARVSLFSLVHDDDEEAQAAQMPFVSSVKTMRVPHLRNKLRGALRLASSIPLTHTLLDAPRASEEVARFAADRVPDVVLAYCSSMARFTLA